MNAKKNTQTKENTDILQLKIHFTSSLRKMYMDDVQRYVDHHKGPYGKHQK